MRVRINNKNYTVPELGFKHMTKLEDMGFSLDDIIRKNKSFSLITGFVAIVVGCDREESEHICEQHVLGGGTFEEITETFMKAMEESAFFRKLLDLGEKKKANVKSLDKEQDQEQ